MGMIGSLLTGGFAAGYRTYIMAGVVVITAVASFSVGDIDLNTLITQIAVGFGMGSLRAALPAAK